MPMHRINKLHVVNSSKVWLTITPTFKVNIRAIKHNTPTFQLNALVIINMRIKLDSFSTEKYVSLNVIQVARDQIIN